MKHAVSAVLFSAVLLGAGPGWSADNPPVRVIDAGELSPDRYTIVKRLWTESWGSAFWIFGRDDAGEAVAAITTEAAGLGADGVINLHCLNDTGSYYCYGLAIKLR